MDISGQFVTKKIHDILWISGQVLKYPEIAQACVERRSERDMQYEGNACDKYYSNIRNIHRLKLKPSSQQCTDLHNLCNRRYISKLCAHLGFQCQLMLVFVVLLPANYVYILIIAATSGYILYPYQNYCHEWEQDSYTGKYKNWCYSIYECLCLQRKCTQFLLEAYYCVLFSSRVMVRVRVSDWSVRGHAHTFVLVSGLMNATRY